MKRTQMKRAGNDQPSKAEEGWREEVRALGPPFCEIHHCVGRTAIHNKVPIGHWLILPLGSDKHRQIHRAIDRRQQERVLWRWMLAAYEERYGPVPIPWDVQQAISDLISKGRYV